LTDPSDPDVPDAGARAEAGGAPPGPGDAAAPAPVAVPITAAPDGPEPDRPSTFSLEGRAVPGLYLVGWVASVMGLAILLVSVLGSGSSAAPWVFLAGILLLTLGVFAATGAQAVERGRRTDLAYRGPSPVLAFILVILLTLIGILVVLAPLSALSLDARSPLATTLSLALTTLVYVGVVRLLVVGPGALAWRDMGLGQPARDAARDLLIGAAFAFPILVITLVLAAGLSRFIEPSPSPLPEAGNVPGLILNLLSAAVLAPIGEELFFRGFVTTAWAKAYGARPAIIRGAIFFAIAHVITLLDSSFAEGAQRALFSFLALLPVSIALGWLFLRRGSLYAAIGLHGTFNGIQALLLFLAASAS
jgi:membrane protease YdiL (CAAX protease family)